MGGFRMLHWDHFLHQRTVCWPWAFFVDLRTNLLFIYSILRILETVTPKIIYKRVLAPITHRWKRYHLKSSLYIYFTNQKEGSFWFQNVQNKPRIPVSVFCCMCKGRNRPQYLGRGQALQEDENMPDRSAPGWRCCPPQLLAPGTGWLQSQWGSMAPRCNWRCPASRPPSPALSGYPQRLARS